MTALPSVPAGLNITFIALTIGFVTSQTLFVHIFEPAEISSVLLNKSSKSRGRVGARFLG